MSHLLNKATSLLATATLAFAMVAGSPAWGADSAGNDAKSEVEQKVDEATQEQTSEKRDQILQEASDAIGETQKALKALDEEAPEKALSALERAAGKLEIILAREPELALAPSDVSAVTIDVLADLDSIDALREAAEDALEDGRLQDARRLIEDLASETAINVTNIPLATYPDAIRRAVKLVDANKFEQAKSVLQTALNTLVVTRTIIPLPIVTAEELLAQAQTLAEKSDRSEAENEQLEKHLADARKELRFAQALGYGSERDFENLHAELDLIKKRTDDGKSGKGFFAEIWNKLEDLVATSQPDSAPESA